MPEAPTASPLRYSRSGIVESLRRVSPDPRGSRLPDHTRGAIDIELLGIRYYGFLIANLYLNARTHLSLAKDAPEPRAIQRQGLGRIVGIPEVGGLHHRYERRAA